MPTATIAELAQIQQKKKCEDISDAPCTDVWDYAKCIKMPASRIVGPSFVREGDDTELRMHYHCLLKESTLIIFLGIVLLPFEDTNFTASN